MKRMTWGTVGALCLVLVGGCPPEDEKADVGAAKDAGTGELGGGEAEGDQPRDGDQTGTQPGDVADDPCARVRCAGGTHCQVTEVECVKAPCDPVVECVADNVSGCAAILCGPADVCVVDASGAASCQPKDAQDNGCTLACTKGQHCEKVAVTCIKAPCDPVPECVDDDACTGFQCTKGQHCELIHPPCAPPPNGLLPPDSCRPQPTCVPDVACGKTTCQGGQECCNASCGICVDPGMGCIQIAC